MLETIQHQSSCPMWLKKKSDPLHHLSVCFLSDAPYAFTCTQTECLRLNSNFDLTHPSTMSLVVLTSGNFLALDAMEPDEVRHFDCDMNIRMRKHFTPSVEILKSFRRDTLVNLGNRVEGFIVKGNKQQLAEGLLRRWVALTNSFAEQYHMVSVFDEEYATSSEEEDVEQTEQEPPSSQSVEGGDANRDEVNRWQRIHILEDMEYQKTGANKIEIGVFAGFEQRKLFTLFFDPRTTEVRELAETVSDVVNMPIHAFRLFEKVSRKVLEPYRRLEEYHNEAYTLDVAIQLRLQGGGGDKKLPSVAVRKEHLKSKEEAITKLKTNIEKVYQPDDDDNIPNEQLNQTFVSFIGEVNTKFTEFLSLKNRCGVAFLSMAMRQVSTEDLQYLETLFSPNRGSGKNLTVEQKSVKALELLYPSLKLLDLCQQKLSYTKQDILSSLMKTFGEEFSNYQPQAGSITLDGTQFLRQVSSELEKRGRTAPDVNEGAFSSCRTQ